jgi:type IX secretion system PorP/SprF family membrane protein|tara:strand:- start:119 stop:943 length:825 start_codon:yes stop_codon:yes gene_type:complete
LFNPVSISPSYAGRLSGTISAGHDQRWVGIDGAPVTSDLSYDVMTKGRFGYNLSVMSNDVGPISNTAVGIVTSYHLRISPDEYFSTGVRYVLNRLDVDLPSERYIDPSDFVIMNGVIRKWYHNVDISGAYYGKRSYFGASLRNAVRTSFFMNDNYGARVIHLYGGSEYKTIYGFDFQYSGLMNIVENTPVDINLHMMLRFKDYLSSGVLIGSSNIGLVYKINSNNGFSFLYQYSFPLSELSLFSQQSHMATIRYGLTKASVFANRIVETPVFFL